MNGIGSCQRRWSTTWSSTARPLDRERCMTAVRTSARGHLAKSAQHSTAAARLAELFHDRPVLTLERSARERSRPDSEMWQQGPFRAEIIPDLPEISNWQDLAAKILRRSARRRPRKPSTHRTAQAEPFNLYATSCLVERGVWLLQPGTSTVLRGFLNQCVAYSGQHQHHKYHLNSNRPCQLLLKAHTNGLYRQWQLRYGLFTLSNVAP